VSNRSYRGHHGAAPRWPRYGAQLRLVIVLTLATALAACGSGATLRKEIVRPPETFASPPAQSGILAELARDIAAKHGEEQSGFSVLDSNRSALYWRIALIDSATTSLDIQTYLWYPDASGILLLEHALRAAERGVRVRLIVDDLLLQGGDALIANLDAHPNVAFRIFNPWQGRDNVLERAGEMLAEMERLNTRMHDKLLIADGRAAVVGGRNIGDHYFGLSETYNFHDTDLLGVGHIGVQANAAFDHFWNSLWVVSAQNLSTKADAALAREQWQKIIETTAGAEILDQFRKPPAYWEDALRSHAGALRIGRSKLLFDEAAEGQIAQSMSASMFNFFALAEEELLIMNAYVIPGEPGIEFLRGLTDKGVDIRILTNSLASHDVPAVNSHYEPWRDDLIQAGVELFEFRSDAAIAGEIVNLPPTQSEFSGLHSKTAVVDRRYAFIGSMNLDPRSAKINTEMGVFVDSPALAEDMARVILRDMSPDNAWRVQLDEKGDLFWENADELLREQPARDGMQRIMNVIMKIGPKEQF